MHTIYAYSTSDSSNKQSSQINSKEDESFLRVRDIVFYTPKWLLKADLLNIHHGWSVKRYQKVITYDVELNQALFFPCAFLKIEQFEKAPIFFSAQSIKLDQNHIFLQDPSLNFGTFKLSLPNLRMQTPHEDLGYFKLAWQNKSPWLETGIKILPWMPWISLIPTIIYSPDTLGFGTHLKHYHQSLRAQLLFKQTGTEHNYLYLQAKNGNHLYALRGTWFSHLGKAQTASVNRKQEFSLARFPLINSEVWQEPYTYFDSKLMLYDHPRFQSYLKYQQSRVMSQLNIALFDDNLHHPQSISQRQSLLYSHHYKDDYYSNILDRFYLNYFSLNVQAQQGVGIVHQPNGRLLNQLSYNEPLLFQEPILIHNHTISLRPSLYSAIGQTSLWAFVHYDASHDLYKKALGSRRSQVYSTFSRQIGFEHALKLNAKYYKSNQLSKSKSFAKTSSVIPLQTYLHQVHLAPRLMVSFNDYLNPLDQLETRDQVEQITRYGLLSKQSLGHSSYQLLLNHWLYSEQVTTTKQSTYKALTLATLLRLSSRQFVIDYIHEPQRYRRALLSVSSQDKTYKSHRFSVYISLLLHEFFERFFETRLPMLNQDFIPLSERILFSGQQRATPFFLTQQSLSAQEQDTQPTGQITSEQASVTQVQIEDKTALGQPFSQNLSQLSLGLSLDAVSLDLSVILAHPNLSATRLNNLQLFAQQTVLAWQSPCRCWHIKLSGLYRPLPKSADTIMDVNMWAFTLSAGLGEPKANIGFTPNFALDSLSHK